VKVAGITVRVFVLLAVILLHAGGGPRHNVRSGEADGHMPRFGIVEDAAPPGGGLGGHTPHEAGR
jgi:hypothetical protein